MAVRALAVVALERREDVATALRSCMISAAAEGELFDAIFDVFWSAEATSLVEVPGAEPSSQGSGAEEDNADGSAPNSPSSTGERDDGELSRRARYSSSGRREGMPVPTADSAREINAVVRRLCRALALSRSRRMRSGRLGELIDVRASMRHNLRFGEELLELRHARPLRERAQLVALCDVSTSMQPFIPNFLTFMHALTRSAAAVEAAIFNVDTCAVTDIFRRRGLSDALGWLADRSVALAGGTRIGHCLHSFNNQIRTRGLVGPAATAFVLSDGWDVGEPELLHDQMRRLRDQVGCLIWLDPHAAAAGYSPQVQGLRVALPFVDLYHDFSSVRSLAELVTQLESPARRQGQPC